MAPQSQNMNITLDCQDPEVFLTLISLQKKAIATVFYVAAVLKVNIRGFRRTVLRIRSEQGKGTCGLNKKVVQYIVFLFYHVRFAHNI